MGADHGRSPAKTGFLLALGLMAAIAGGCGSGSAQTATRASTHPVAATTASVTTPAPSPPVVSFTWHDLVQGPVPFTARLSSLRTDPGGFPGSGGPPLNQTYLMLQVAITSGVTGRTINPPIELDRAISCHGPGSASWQYITSGYDRGSSEAPDSGGYSTNFASGEPQLWDEQWQVPNTLNPAVVSCAMRSDLMLYGGKQVGAQVNGSGLLTGPAGTPPPSAATPASANSGVRQLGEGTTLFDGIPEHGATLGSPTAPMTLTEYIDLQSPICAQYDKDALPQLVQRFVRPGTLKLQLVIADFIGKDSVTAAQVAIAASNQSKLWEFTHLLFARQGVENQGYVTPSFLEAIEGQITGLDIGRVQREANEATTQRTLAVMQAQIASQRIEGVPEFFLGRGQQPPKRLSVTDFTNPAVFIEAVQQAVR